MTDDIPAVCFVVDLVRILRTSETTIKRLRRHRAFPIRELPAIDKRPRWSGKDVREFIDNKVSSTPRRLRRVS